MTELYGGIKLEKMPKLFQEVIAVCGWFDIRYLWIDSLCIQQDSQDDWETQGSKMAAIYSNCILAIVADCACDSSASIFERNEILLCDKKVGELEGGAHIRARHARGMSDQGGFTHCPLYSDLPNPNYLQDRAWTLQETLLPPRTLHFTSTELVWSCKKTNRCECRVVEFEQDHTHDNTREKMNLSSYRAWVRILKNEYARRSLTFDKDRLVAVSGLAAKFHATRPKVKYLAGLWESNLPAALACAPPWHNKETPMGTRIKMPDYVAPSRPWAGMIGDFESDTYDDNGEGEGSLRVIAVDCEPASKNLYESAAEGSSITVEGGCLDFRVCHEDGEEHEIELLGIIDCDEPQMFRTRVLFDVKQEKDDVLSQRQDLVLLYVCEKESRSTSYVVLRRMDGPQGNKGFQRVGFLGFYMAWEDTPVFQAFAKHKESRR